MSRQVLGWLIVGALLAAVSLWVWFRHDPLLDAYVKECDEREQTAARAPRTEESER
jgi:hypothetical protein